MRTLIKKLFSRLDRAGLKLPSALSGPNGETAATIGDVIRFILLSRKYAALHAASKGLVDEKKMGDIEETIKRSQELQVLLLSSNVIPQFEHQAHACDSLRSDVVFHTLTQEELKRLDILFVMASQYEHDITVVATFQKSFGVRLLELTSKVNRRNLQAVAALLAKEETLVSDAKWYNKNLSFVLTWLAIYALLTMMMLASFVFGGTMIASALRGDVKGRSREIARLEERRLDLSSELSSMGGVMQAILERDCLGGQKVQLKELESNLEAKRRTLINAITSEKKLRSKLNDVIERRNENKKKV